jgi:membrane protein DedA with SNARE-associated domain
MHLLGFSLDYSGAISHMFAWQRWLAMHSWQWVQGHGYVAMVALLFLSGAGLPLPEDIPLIAAGVSIARGGMTWAVAGPVAWFAMMLGDTSLYILGYIFAWRVVHLPLIGRHITTKRLQKCEACFHRWGILAIGIGRLFTGIRSAMVVAAGTLRFNYGKMLAADGIAAIVSGGAFMLMGYFAGRHAGQTRDFIEKYRQIFTPIALAAALALVIALWIRNRRRAAGEKIEATKQAAEHEAEPEIAETIKPA